MNHSIHEGLRSLVTQDKNHIKHFLKVHKIQLKDNRVTLRFFKGDTTGLNQNNLQEFIDQYKFPNLWEIDGEPAFVVVQFAIFKQPRENTNKFLRQMNNLLNKICSRSWPDNLDTPQEYLANCNNICIHERLIDYNPTNNKVILIGGICYCC